MFCHVVIISDANIKKYLDLCNKALLEEKQLERDRCKAMFASSDKTDISSTST